MSMTVRTEIWDGARLIATLRLGVDVHVIGDHVAGVLWLSLNDRGRSRDDAMCMIRATPVGVLEAIEHNRRRIASTTGTSIT